MFFGKFFRASLIAKGVSIDQSTGSLEFAPILMLNQGLGDESDNGISILMIGQLRLMQYLRETQNTD